MLLLVAECMNEKRSKIQFELPLDALEEISGATTRVDLLRRALHFFSWLAYDVAVGDTIQVLDKEVMYGEKYT
jgi:hypothetical protein